MEREGRQDGTLSKPFSASGNAGALPSWDRAERDAHLLAQRAIDVLPAEASHERSKAHYAAEMVLRELREPNKVNRAAAKRTATARLERMWHPALNGSRQFADVPGRSIGKYWWRCVQVEGHDEPWLATVAQAEKPLACPACAESAAARKGRRRKKGKGSLQKQSTSVWAVSGGLPTLGRRR